MTAAPIVSVVTPVYNGAAYLEECIESVLRQTYSQYEYLIVDNASTDETATIVERHASRDRRIRLVREKEFVGIWANHNRALRSIDPRSRYCKVVHADDLLFPECLAQMVEVADAHSSAGVVGAFRLVGARVEHDGLLPLSQKLMLGREVVRRGLLGGPWVTGSPTSLLYRAEIVREQSAFYDEAVWHADTDAAYRSLLKSDLAFVHQVLTFTRVHDAALTSFSYRVNTFCPQVGRMLLRYGPALLDAREYRGQVRPWLREYGYYLTREMLRRARRRDETFRDFHLREIADMAAEARQDAGTRLWLWTFRQLIETASRGVPSSRRCASSVHTEASRYTRSPTDGASISPQV